MFKVLSISTMIPTSYCFMMFREWPLAYNIRTSQRDETPSTSYKVQWKFNSIFLSLHIQLNLILFMSLGSCYQPLSWSLCKTCFYHCFHFSKDIVWHIYICDWHQVCKFHYISHCYDMRGLSIGCWFKYIKFLCLCLIPCSLLVQFDVQSHVIWCYGCELYKKHVIVFIIVAKLTIMGQWCVLCDVLFNGLIPIGEHHHFKILKKTLCRIDMPKKLMKWNTLLLNMNHYRLYTW
jgi:hypothetical protein